VTLLVGLSVEDVVGTPFSDLVHPQDRGVVRAFLDDAGDPRTGVRSAEFRIAHQAGRWVTVEALAGSADAAVASDGEGVVLTLRDTTERRAFEEQLAHQAFHDVLTGLPNRALFADRLGHALSRRPDDASTIAVLFIDLDDFKTVNDSLGHDAGDAVLREMAARLQRCLRGGDTPARLGGDEFAVLLESVCDAEEALETGRRIVRSFAEPLRLDGRELSASVCVGVALGLPQLSEPAELLRDADTAMYVAKGRGRGTVELFEQGMHSVAARRLSLTSDLEGALQRGEFVVHYQPTVSLDSGEILGFEALVRWQPPDRGLVAPMEFIPLAEETGLIVPLGAWVLAEAARQAVAWHAAFPTSPPRTMSVNLSVRQIERDDFVDAVRALLAEVPLPPRTLVLEITEGVLLRDTAQVAQRLRALKELGVLLAIDDFGTGYSSLGYLQTLPLDILKIDKRFVDTVATGANSTALASAIIAIGAAMGLQTVAEGIEHEEQAATLRRLSCQVGQGYMFARPGSPEVIDRLLAGGARSDPRPVRSSTVPAAEVRRWARAHGLEVADRGPLPAATVAAYLAARRDGVLHADASSTSTGRT
jgi:diguanylate cyclase (GGDEF)-like protein/PAS domain S-box-containing protein